MAAKRKSVGWDNGAKWRMVEASPENHNPLIEDVLKPLHREISKVLKMQLKELDKKVRGK